MKDNESHFELVRNILKLNETSSLRLSTSTFVLSEIIYTEQSIYKINRNETVKDIRMISLIKNIFLVDQTYLSKTIELFSQYSNVKWSDCIIATQVPKNYKLCSFDAGLEKIIGKERFISPEEVVKTF